MRPAILFSAIILAVGVAGATPPRAEAQARADDPSAARVAAAARIADALARLAKGEGDWTPFALTYDDLHGLHGGLTLTIRGNGAVTQQAVRQIAGGPRNVSPAALRQLAALLERHRAWEQREADRPARPDESKARLAIAYGADTVAIWEWHNDLAKNRRIVEIREAMQRAAWREMPKR